MTIKKQKTVQKDKDSKTVLKKRKKAPKKLKPDEARAIERYHLIKEKHDLSMKILKLEEALANEVLRSKTLVLNLSKISLSGEFETERVSYNSLVDGIKLRFGVDDFSYDPETLKLEKV